MTPENFVYWLQGFVEVENKVPDERQWEIIKDHLREVFHKVTPDRSREGTYCSPHLSHAYQGHNPAGIDPKALDCRAYGSGIPYVTGIPPKLEEALKMDPGALGTIGYFYDNEGKLHEAGKINTFRPTYTC
jgi:hypothetical protein